MIKRYFSLLMFTAVLAACGGGEDKSAEKLQKLKKERADLDKQIADLEKQTKDTTNIKQKTVTVATVQDTLFEHYIDVQGSVDARENVDVSAKSPGVITNIYVKEGQRVSKGQTLAQIDDQVMRSNVAEVKTQLDLANIAFEKQQRLWNQKIGTEMQYLTAKNQKESLEKRISTLNDQLALNRIVSPISGTVDAVIAKLGDQAAPGAPSFRVVNTSNLKVVANVAESYAGRVKTGDPVVIVLPDINKEIRTKISFASKVIDPLSRTIKVEIPLAADAALRPNMIAQLKIVDYVAPNAVVVPVGVLQYSMGKPYVITAKKSNGKLVAERKDVELGQTYNDKAEIKSGLSAGEQIVTTGFQGLNSNDLIKL
ncbi:efflux RND transporter periplasmic adaptor subunit [Chitinophaga horti]|uniref:Efflux RND transporter periplasmic adaptor subunit n=1 Tax=Chitinophaga horti TaxID=2920382 RepID=A0ABY6IY62_9BACT|nr:efflux RND transporter periplasmic adaptor subunit [Chitinophaga horti]UYQ92314.1 efflux RND transporter periplasmic adaptor subunit [Chitinophaga horti]